MLFRILFYLVLLAGTPTHAFTAAEALTCVKQALGNVSTLTDLKPIIQRRLHSPALAERIASVRFRDTLAQLPIDTQLRIAVAINERIDDLSALGDIEPESVVLHERSVKKNRGAYEVAGHFTNRKFRTREDFALLVAPGCLLIDAVWQNVWLSRNIANKL